MATPDKVYLSKSVSGMFVDFGDSSGIEYTRTAPIPTDARLVSVAQLKRAETCLRNSGFVKAADELRAIIGDNGNG